MFDGPPLPVGGMAELRAGHPVSTGSTKQHRLARPGAGVGGGNVRLGWQPPGTRIQEAAELAAGCDVVVVLASTAVVASPAVLRAQAGEGMDRASLSLPGEQDRLVAAVAEANPRTVVVLNTGGPVLMPWLDRVVHPGRYEVLVGRSSRDVRGRAGFEVDASRGRPERV